MILHDRTPQKVAIQMRIDLRSSDGGMSQHLLYGTQIGSPLYQMCGKGVAEGVRTDRLLETDGSGAGFDNVENHYTG